MSTLDVFGLCVRSLIKRKLRTFLTLLGVIIGTASIVLMMSLGMATEAQFAEMMEGMDADLTMISVSPARWRPTPGGGWEMADFVPELDDFAINSFNAIPGVIVASPIVQGGFFMRSGRYGAQVSWDVVGIRPEALALMGHNVAEGRLLGASNGLQNIEAVFGGLAELNFYEPFSDEMRVWNMWELDLDNLEHFVDVMNDPIQISYDSRIAPPLWDPRRWGGEIDEELDDIEDVFRPITSFDLNVVGVLERTGDNWGDTRIYVAIDVLEELNWLRDEHQREMEQEWMGWFSAIEGERERTSYESAFVRVASMDDTHRVAEAISEMGFQAHYAGEMINNQRRQQQSIRTLLTAIAAISLLVATINIANTMITSVTERTKEIGVMKVIGASIRDVRRMFLLEAVMIGIMGGLFGIGVSLIGSYVMNNFDIPFLEGLGPPDMSGWWGMPAAPENPTVSLITPSLLLLALGVAAGVGLVAGYFPARRATKLSALAAIRAD
ncbi:MAG: ABC transporter permease [Defluviitaleaceae bacterium]|nr:ABC transporter permease [Defluviitaleaceae bacterium]